MLRYLVHYATKVFAARTLHSVVVVSNLVALVALIVSYPILLLTKNNTMMISVRRMFKKMAIKNYLSCHQRRQRQATKQKGRSWAKGQSHIHASMTNILLILLEYPLLITLYNSG